MATRWETNNLLPRQRPGMGTGMVGGFPGGGANPPGSRGGQQFSQPGGGGGMPSPRRLPGLPGAALGAAGVRRSPHQQFDAWEAAGRKGASGANAPTNSSGDEPTRTNQLRQAITQGRLPTPMSPSTGTGGGGLGTPTATNLGPGAPPRSQGGGAGVGTPGGGPDAAFSDVAQLQRFQGPLQSQSATANPLALTGFGGSAQPIPDPMAAGAAPPGGAPGLGTPTPTNFMSAPPTGGGNSQGLGGMLASSGPAQDSQGGGGFGAQPTSNLGAATPPGGSGQGLVRSPFAPTPTLPMRPLGSTPPPWNAPRVNPGAGGVHPALGGFGTSMGTM